MIEAMILAAAVLKKMIMSIWKCDIEIWTLTLLFYCIRLWLDYIWNDIENVQKRATKLIISLKKLSYIERLKQLQLPTLKYRRSRGDMMKSSK